MQLNASLKTLRNMAPTNMPKRRIMIVPIIMVVVSSGFSAVDLSRMKPTIPGTPQIKITPVIVTIWLMRSTRKNNGKFSNMSERVDLALSK